MKKQAHARRGFTLIELMIVLAIVGILLGLGTYSYVTQVRTLRLVGDMRELNQTLQLARMRTLATGMPHGVVFYEVVGSDSITRTYYYIFSDCKSDEQFTDPDSDPANNTPVANAEACAASTLTQDPKMAGDPIHQINELNRIASFPNNLAYIVFNNLGQTVQGVNNPVFGDIVMTGPAKDEGMVNEIRVHISASGLTEILPYHTVPE